jgi:hypothetical protein
MRLSMACKKGQFDKRVVTLGSDEVGIKIICTF